MSVTTTTLTTHPGPKTAAGPSSPSSSSPAAAPRLTKSESRKSHERIELREVSRLETSTSTRNHDDNDSNSPTTRDQDLPAPSTAVDAMERWNAPKSNMYRLFATFVSFFVLGLNDATPGVSGSCFRFRTLFTVDGLVLMLMRLGFLDCRL